MASVIGIDLGTTSSRVAIVVEGAPAIIENSEGEGTTPSYVALTLDGARLVGESARRYSLVHPENVVFAVKRLIGRTYDDPVVQELRRFMPFDIVRSENGDAWVRIQDKDYAPEQIAAFILQKMKKTAEDYLGEEVTRAVITVPASFNDRQRQSARDAATIAGLDVLRLEDEPTMAAIAYGVPRRLESGLIAVYDLGGGTFDISILEIGEGVFEVKSTGGDMFLGGEDFDNKLVDYLASTFKAKHGVDLLANRIARQRLRQAAETAKISLSSAETVNVDLPFIHATDNLTLHVAETITRKKFEGLIDTLVQRSIEVCRRALKDAEITPEKVDRIVLVGGSTRIPYIQSELFRLFNKGPYGGLRREDAVALGAAISGAILTGNIKDVLLLDVIPMSLGIETLGGVFTRIIQRHTTRPTKSTVTFSTADDDQTAVTIRVFQGEHDEAAKNDLLAQFDLVDIPRARKGIPQIEVTFDVDVNGLLRVTAKDKATSKEQAISVKASGRLSTVDVQRMKLDAQHVGILPTTSVPQVHVMDQAYSMSREEGVEAAPAIVRADSQKTRAIPKVFLSYAREDDEWAQLIVKSLAVLTHSGKAELWSDHSIRTGAAWEERIFEQIERSNVAILLLSSDFLYSEFIRAKELPAIFAQRERNELAIIPIIVRPCAFSQHDQLSKFQLFNKPNASLSKLPRWQAEEEMVRLIEQLAKTAFVE